MAASKFTIPFSPAFQQLLHSAGIEDLIARVDAVMAADDSNSDSVRECTAQACPILGLHNTDECAWLIERAKNEGAF